MTEDQDKTIICEECNKKAIDVRKYLNGDRLFVHTQKTKKKPFPHILIGRACFVKAKKKVK